MKAPPRTQRGLWAAVPRETWLGSRMDLATIVGAARDELESWLSGASWRAIGVLLGVSRQAAAKRYGAAVRSAVEAIQDKEEQEGG